MKKGEEERKAIISFYIGYFGDVLAEKKQRERGPFGDTIFKIPASYAIIYRSSFHKKISLMNEW